MDGGQAVMLVVMLGALLFAPVAGATAGTAGEVALTVSVVDSRGLAVQDAELTATWDGGSTTETTASNGKAFVDVPQGADVSIDVTHPDYVRNFPKTVEGASERDVTVQVAQKGRATIGVTGPDGAAVRDARVTVSQDGRTVASGRTGSGGTFETGVVERGSYRVHVVKPGYVSNATQLTVGESTETTLAIHQKSVLLGVTVVDDHFDAPRRVENVTIDVGDVATVNARNGQGAVSVPVNDEYTITVRKEGYSTTEHRVSVGESATNVTVTINRAPSLTVEPANRQVVVGEAVRVTVTDEYGAPVAAATLAVDGEAAATTGADGVASVPIERAGTNEIRATKGDVTSAPVNVTGVSSTTATETAAETTATTSTTTTSSGIGPGFGAGAALVALGVAVLARRASR